MSKDGINYIDIDLALSGISSSLDMYLLTTLDCGMKMLICALSAVKLALKPLRLEL